MPVVDRLTRPLARIDRPVNALNDGTVRLVPWLWWPASPPRRDRPWSAGQHIAYVGWSLASFVLGEVVAARLPAELRSTGARLRNERLITGVAGLAAWVVAAGAWVAPGGHAVAARCSAADGAARDATGRRVWSWKMSCARGRGARRWRARETSTGRALPR